MAKVWPEGLVSIRGIAGCFHVLTDGDTAVILDAGLMGERRAVRRALCRVGLGSESVRAILLTHGHLDHTGNLRWLREWTGAPVYAHPLEQPHIDGCFPYCDASRVCGWMEASGRALLRYHGVPIDRPLADGDELPFWGGLRVVHLPGHTAGHCGFYSARHNLLFSGDLFASYFFSVHRPPAILNSCPEHFRASFEKVRALDPSLIVPNHYDFRDGALHRRRFGRLIEKNSTKAGRS